MEQKTTSMALSGEVTKGDWVLSVDNNVYEYMIGRVLEIVKLGTPEHAEETGNDCDSIHVDFAAFDYPQKRIIEFEDRFSELYNEQKSWDELSIDDVIMAPDMLIVVTQLGAAEIKRLGKSRTSCESYCRNLIHSAT